MTEQSIFLAALDIADPTERGAYLDETCGGDPALRQQVEELLAAHERSGEFLKVPALRQIAAGAGNGQPSPGETSAEGANAKGEIDLSFLQPSTKPGSLGRLAHYEVEQVIGRGGCGIVLKAFDEKLRRVVAIKVMAPELATTSPARKRFLREARAAAAIRHENVIGIHAVEDQPLPYLVMEYIEGLTLQQKLDQTGPLDVREVLHIGRQVAAGLAAAHAQGLIHRDIKPGNILLENGKDHIKITDFGLARSADDASLTQSGVIAGTPLYMSPEQAQGQGIDHRSDLFSLGSVLYVMVSGRPPFRAATTLAVLKRVAEDQPRPIREIIPEAPDWLIALIGKLHAKNPDARFASAQEVADLLARCLSEMQQHGCVQSPGDLLPMTLKPTDEAERSAQNERRSGKENAIPAAVSKPVRRWAAAAAVAVALFAGLGMTEATGLTNVRGTVIRLFSPDGTLVVEVDDPGVSVTIDGEEMVISGTGAKEIRLKPGQYKLLASKDGKVVRQELVTVTTNGRQVVRVSKEAGPTGADPGVIEPKVADPDRRAAEYVLSVGGRVQINDIARFIDRPADLPNAPFRLTCVWAEWKPKLDDAGLANFAGCRHLKELRLWQTLATEKGLAHLKDCKSLTTLSLHSNLLTDAALGHFAGCDDLQVLDLHSCYKITAAGLAHFKDYKRLKTLVLRHVRVGDAALVHFKDCKELRVLDLGETAISDAGLENFKDCKNLEYLWLFGNPKITDAGLAHFQDCRQIKDLNLARLPMVTDKGLASFQNCTGLEQLHLAGTQVSNDGFGLFKGCKELWHLVLFDTPLTDAALAQVKGYPLLKELDLSGTRVTEAGLAHLKDCPALTRLGMQRTVLTDGSIETLGHLWRLKWLDLRDAKLPEGGLEKLAAKLPQCKIERIVP